MKRPFQKTATHATALLVGVLLAPALVRVMEIIHPATGSTAAAGDSAASELPAADSAATGASRTSRAEAFRQAWRELSLRPATREERLESQRKMLKLWADYDLDSALHAAAAEGGNLLYETNNAAMLNQVFAEAFGKHPEEAWRILAKNDLGMEQSQLERNWFSQLRTRPGMIISRLAEMNVFQQDQAVSMLRVYGPSLENAPEIRAALLKSGVGEAQLANFLLLTQAQPSGDTLDWTALPTGPERTAARAGWAAQLATLDPAAYAAAWESVPEPDRPEVARLTVATLHDSPLLLPALDHLIATGQWDILGSDLISSAFQTQAAAADPFAPRSEDTPAPGPHGPDHAALIEWAAGLPDRPETARLIETLQPPADPFAPAGASTPDSSATARDDFPPGTWQHDEVLLLQISRTASSAGSQLQELASRITGPARQQQAQEIIRRAALLKSMR